MSAWISALHAGMTKSDARPTFTEFSHRLFERETDVSRNCDQQLLKIPSVLALWVICSLLLLAACSPHLSVLLPTVRDHTLEAFLRREASTILAVSENATRTNHYSFHLAEFPSANILGLSVGNHEIFINYELTRLAYDQNGYLWLMRQVLAHEIAHDVLGKVSSGPGADSISLADVGARISEKDLGLPSTVTFRNYSRAAELAADKRGIEYWQKAGWDCRIWINIFQNFLDQGYLGTPDHPTKERLSQAIEMCGSELPSKS